MQTVTICEKLVPIKIANYKLYRLLSIDNKIILCIQDSVEDAAS